MATMNISLPDKMKEWVESRTATGRYSNASDYVRDLIRSDLEREKRRREFQMEIDKGLKSGISSRSKADLLKLARAKVG
jgi:antitoxin ParD1/3/4